MYRTRGCATLLAVSLLLFATTQGFVQAESARRVGTSLDSGSVKSIRLSIRISGAKRKGRQVSFYKSVARQEKTRPTGGRSPSSGR